MLTDRVLDQMIAWAAVRDSAPRGRHLLDPPTRNLDRPRAILSIVEMRRENVIDDPGIDNRAGESLYACANLSVGRRNIRDD